MTDRNTLADLAVGGPAHPRPEQAAPLLAFLDGLQGGPFAMVNLFTFRAWARYRADYDGRDGPPDVSGREAFARYLSVARGLRSGAGVELLWAGAPGPAWVGRSASWDFAVIARYPHAAAFEARMADPEYRRFALPHRAAALKRALTFPIARATGVAG